MHYYIWLMGLKYTSHFISITNIHMLKIISVAFAYMSKSLQITSIS